MKCNKCRKSVPCGCADVALTTVPTYQDSTTCPTPQICAEFTYTGCVIYNGPELTELNISPGMNMNQVIQALVLLNLNPACITTTCPSVLLNVIKTTKTTIDIGWLALPSVVTYTFSYLDTTASPEVWVDITDISPSAVHYNLTGLTCDTPYEIKITANYADPEEACTSLTILVSTLSC